MLVAWNVAHRVGGVFVPIACYRTITTAQGAMKNYNHKLNLMPKPSRPSNPSLRFTPTAWAKLLYLRDCGETEVGGFGIAETEDLLLVTDLTLVDQVCSFATVAFDDAAVADLFDEQVDLGLRPAQFARIWAHTHPGDSADPSSVDEETFGRVFGGTDWAVMFILARGGETYARLRFNNGPGGAIELPVQVDYSQPFDASDHEAWEAEYLAKVQQKIWPPAEKAQLDGSAAKGDVHEEEQVAAAVSEFSDWNPYWMEDDPWYD